MSSHIQINKTKTNPGIHKLFKLFQFSKEEQIILNKLKNEWYLTNSGQIFTLGHSRFRSFLIKPTQVFSEMFNIDREIICIFSNYESFEPRTLDAFDYAVSKYPSLRIENVCRMLISKDRNTEEKISNLLKSDPEQPIVIPFTYEELSSTYDSYFIRNRFQKHFYTRDLFAFLSPLRKDLYFFGRSELIQSIVNRHRSGEHNALFGLRKSGKTSIIFAIERTLANHNEDTLIIDCENPSVHKLRWNELLHHIVELLRKKRNVDCQINSEKQYSEKKSASLFEKDILGIYNIAKQPTLLIFDEIERISPNTGSSDHWRSGEDFVYFWQTLRYFYQKYPEVFTYMLVGTNPYCVEKPTFGNHDNPLFGSIPFQYVPSFTIPQTRKMVRKLGRFMGLRFDELIYSKLNEDFGGHPFLMRYVCSTINSLSKGERPIRVDKPLYEKAKRDFLLHSKQYFEMIIQVLHEWYPDEYGMLVFLANEDIDAFNDFAQDSNYYTSHLVGYGLISMSDNGYCFNIESVKDYILTRNKYEDRRLTPEKQMEEISKRRIALEKNLRLIIRNQLKSFYGRKIASQKVINAIPEKRRALLPVDIDQLLVSNKSSLYFLDLINIISREWGSFQNVFELDKSKLIIMLREINQLRRPEHANDPTEDEFTQIRLHFNKLESIISNWLS
ncbi:MAG: hypothetical protein K8R40_08720 [Anaerolineaceae bacterium]|nr:hypothetical protein [Anaerolineaceae bacterium]